MQNWLSKKNITFYSIVFILALIAFTNAIRAIIFIRGYIGVGRIPTFLDGFAIPKYIVFTHRFDESVLLFRHFLNPLLLLLVAILFVVIYREGGRKILRLKLAFIATFAIEILMRLSDGYGYILFD